RGFRAGAFHPDLAARAGAGRLSHPERAHDPADPRSSDLLESLKFILHPIAWPVLPKPAAQHTVGRDSIQKIDCFSISWV
ncbi:MAG: hypothetical protein ACLFQF_08405, partial [Rhodosalinus sp.]